MTPSNYQRTRWLTLIGTIITQFALGSVYTWSLFNGALSAKLDAPVSQVAFCQAGCAGKPGRFLFRLVKSGAGNFVFCCGQIAGTFWR